MDIGFNKFASEWWKKFFDFQGAKTQMKISEHLKHVNLKMSAVGDKEIRLLSSNVKTIETLDLEGTEVSNTSILYLTKLQSLKELRLTNCRQIDDGCLPFLNQLFSLEYLYLGGTAITHKGIQGCDNLQNLKSINISVKDTENSNPGLIALQHTFPNCKLVVNDVYYRFDRLKVI
ncbi:hypothetical protein ACFSJU_16960 [Paradesertivirga mongoliensis]|uniref:Uncharacterized protein n=1 Tax=Paradesertivirga mongoliensis TaxID=2100740 RepID=A0ABW4ZR42_9SPHI|nr:hypothetical protein [Pedobacter mongoliensis]